jgi:N-acetylmuramoyl-L-alanine amidase
MRPSVIKKSSPNFTKATGRKISCVVLHATATSGVASPLEWLCLKASKVSSHYLIDKDGTIYQLVAEKDIAWHAGQSFWGGKHNVNDFSIGIELVNPNDGIYPYPEEQRQACADLVVAICKEHRIAAKDVVGHCDVALGRKTDPAGFDMEEFRARLARAGVL